MNRVKYTRAQLLRDDFVRSRFPRAAAATPASSPSPTGPYVNENGNVFYDALNAPLPARRRRTLRRKVYVSRRGRSSRTPAPNPKRGRGSRVVTSAAAIGAMVGLQRWADRAPPHPNRARQPRKPLAIRPATANTTTALVLVPKKTPKTPQTRNRGMLLLPPASSSTSSSNGRRVSAAAAAAAGGAVAFLPLAVAAGAYLKRTSKKKKVT